MIREMLLKKTLRIKFIIFQHFIKNIMVFPENRQILNSLVTKQENKNSICLLYKTFRNGYRPHMIVKSHKVILKIRKKNGKIRKISIFLDCMGDPFPT